MLRCFGVMKMVQRVSSALHPRYGCVELRSVHGGMGGCSRVAFVIVQDESRCSYYFLKSQVSLSKS